MTGFESASAQLNIRLANDSVSNDKHHSEVGDLFAQWDSDPLALVSLPDLEM